MHRIGGVERTCEAPYLKCGLVERRVLPLARECVLVAMYGLAAVVGCVMV